MTEITIESAKAALIAALEKAGCGVERLYDTERELPYTDGPDDLAKIEEFLEAGKAAKNRLQEAYAALSLPLLRQKQAIDAARGELWMVLNEPLERARLRYNSLNYQAQQRRKNEEFEESRQRRILGGIAVNAEHFAHKIKAAQTAEELSAVEALIESEKTKRDKYAEFFDEAMVRYEPLLQTLRDQKQALRHQKAIQSE